MFTTENVGWLWYWEMTIDEEEATEQVAAARRERLNALKAAKQLLENPEDDENGDNDDELKK